MRIQLGPLVPRDELHLFLWENNDDARRWNGAWRPVDQMTFHNTFMNLGRDPSVCTLAIRSSNDDPTDDLLGYVRLAHLHPVYRSGDIGITISPQFRRRGIGTAALAMAVDFAWRHLNLLRLSLNVVDNNAAARNLYRIAGFQEEGVLRRAVYCDNAWRDLVLMALLRDTPSLDT